MPDGDLVARLPLYNEAHPARNVLSGVQQDRSLPGNRKHLELSNLTNRRTTGGIEDAKIEIDAPDGSPAGVIEIGL